MIFNTDFGSGIGPVNPLTGVGFTSRSGIATLVAATNLAQQASGRAVGSAMVGLAPSATIDLTSAMGAAIGAVAANLTVSVEGFETALLSQQRRNRDDRVRRIHQLAGEAGQRATLEAYDRAHIHRQTFARKNRIAGGKLRKALASPEYFTARWDGIAIGNRNVLDRQAAQWYRLNYGVGPRGEAAPVKIPAIIEFFGEAIGDISSQTGPSIRPMWIPKGSWYQFGPGKAGRAPWDGANRGQHQFVAGGKRFKLTQGIQGSGFIDMGISATAASVGEGWTSLLLEWTHEASEAGTGPLNFLTRPQAAESLALLETQVPNIEAIFAKFKTDLQTLRYNQRALIPR